MIFEAFTDQYLELPNAYNSQNHLLPSKVKQRNAKSVQTKKESRRTAKAGLDKIG